MKPTTPAEPWSLETPGFKVSPVRDGMPARKQAGGSVTTHTSEGSQP
jgi:hypothetical protein